MKKLFIATIMVLAFGLAYADTQVEQKSYTRAEIRAVNLLVIVGGARIGGVQITTTDNKSYYFRLEGTNYIRDANDLISRILSGTSVVMRLRPASTQTPGSGMRDIHQLWVVTRISNN